MTQVVKDLVTWLQQWFYTETEVNTLLSEKTDEDDLLDLLYPIGAIYIDANTSNSTCPIATTLGGTWERIQDKFLLASTDQQGVGTTGGEATHTLTTNEMPSHTHIQNAHNHTQNSHTHNFGTDNGATIRFNKNDNWGYTSKRSMQSTSGNYYYPYSNANGDGIGEIDHVGYTTATNQSQTATNQNEGGGQAHNNMPPYLMVNVWKRTA